MYAWYGHYLVDSLDCIDLNQLCVEFLHRSISMAYTLLRECPVCPVCVNKRLLHCAIQVCQHAQCHLIK